jgi:hypothetical protein
MRSSPSGSASTMIELVAGGERIVEIEQLWLDGSVRDLRALDHEVRDLAKLRSRVAEGRHFRGAQRGNPAAAHVCRRELVPEEQRRQGH